MSALILAENKLHHGYYRADNKITITQDSGVIVGHEFDKCIDGNSSTSFKSSVRTPTVTITFPTAVAMNGFAVYGYTGSPSLGISYDQATDGFVPFPEFNSSNPDPAVPSQDPTLSGSNSQRYKPKQNGGGPFGAAFREGEHVMVKSLQIQFSLNDNESIECIAFGLWVRTQFVFSMPFNAPVLQARKNAMKRGPRAAYLRCGSRKVGEKIKLQFRDISLSELYKPDFFEKNSLTSELRQTINGQTKSFPLIEYLGHYLPRYPFFVIHENGALSDFINQVNTNARITYCIPYKASAMPRYSGASNLSWSINALGYFS